MSEMPQDIGWLVWNFDRASGREAWLVPHIPEAIKAFAAEHETGGLAAHWLQAEAAKASSDSVTWLYYDAMTKHIEAFFSVRKTDRLTETSGVSSDQPLEVASEIVWLCKHKDAKLHGKKIMAMAIRKAYGLWGDYPPGTVVTLLLNPQGADTKKLRKKYRAWKKVPGRDDLLVTQLEIRADFPPRLMGG
ncbi:MAG TPA: hypothetical protein VMT37_05200 [Solirubrobacterales bacterium]|nr:hypothetical protein [Solirubrobacterales bacterium]